MIDIRPIEHGLFRAAHLLHGLLILLLCAGLLHAALAETLPLQTDSVADRLKMRDVLELQQMARAEGEIRVVVGLGLPNPFSAEGKLAPAERAAQRAAIARAGEQLELILASHRARINRRYKTLPAMALTVDAAALDVLVRRGLVDHVQLDEAVPPTLATSTEVVGAPAAWSHGMDGAGQAVVILDTGIDGDHPFFQDEVGTSRIVAEACFSNAGGAGLQTTLCPNETPSQSGPGASEVRIPACLRDNGSQLCNHGVHVAGIAVGRGDSSSGVARGSDIISVQVFTRFDSNCPGDNDPCVLSYTSDHLAAMDYVFGSLHGVHNIASVNMSFGGGSVTSPCDFDIRKAAVDQLRAVGVATAIAAGNGRERNAIIAPACISTAIAVGSTTHSDEVSDFSNVHEMMDFFAPGNRIRSAVAGGGFRSLSGTSMSTPHVAGAWAVLKQAKPDATVSEILEALVAKGVPVTDQRSGGTVTKPRIQIDAALDYLDASVWLGGTNGDWAESSNWSTGSSPDCSSNVLITADAGQPVISAAAAANNLKLEDGAGLAVIGGVLEVCGNLAALGTGTSLSFDAAASILVEGDLINAGTIDINGAQLAVNGAVINAGILSDVRAVPAATTTHVLEIRNEDNTAWAFRGVEITPAGPSLGLTSVIIGGRQDCSPPDGGSLFRRCFDITPEFNEAASVRFWLTEAERNAQDAATVIVFRHDGEDWVEASDTRSYAWSGTSKTCSSVDGDQCWVQAEQVVEFSRFAVGAPSFAIQQYTIGGTVTGLAGGNSVTLQNKQGDDLIVMEDGAFTFPAALDDGESYAVTVAALTGSVLQRCDVTAGAGMVAGTDVEDVEINCVTLGDELFMDRFANTH